MRKVLKAQITAREIEEKRLLEAKRERNRLEIKLKEEKLRKLKLYEAEQIRLHMEEEKVGKSANNRMTRKKDIADRSVTSRRNGRSTFHT